MKLIPPSPPARKKGKKLFLFFSAILALAAAGTAFRGGARLLSLDREAAALSKALRNSASPDGPMLDLLEKRIGELRIASAGAALPEAASPAGPRSLAVRTAMLRGLLAGKGLRPERFRISGGGDGESAEFFLRGEVGPFLDFLDEAVRVQGTAIHFLGIKMIPDREEAGGRAREAEITFRFDDAEGPRHLRPGPGASIPGRFFRHDGNGRRAGNAAEAPAPEEKPVPGEEREPEERLLFLGTIRDIAGVEYSYFKEADSGLIHKIEKITRRDTDR